MRNDPIGNPLEDLTNYLEENRTSLSVAEPELVNRIDNLLIVMKKHEMKMAVGMDSNKVVGYAYTSYNADFKVEKEEDDDVGDRL